MALKVEMSFKDKDCPEYCRAQMALEFNAEHMVKTVEDQEAEDGNADQGPILQMSTDPLECPHGLKSGCFAEIIRVRDAIGNKLKEKNCSSGGGCSGGGCGKEKNDGCCKGKGEGGGCCKDRE